MDYIPVIPESIRDALNRIKITEFSMILLHETYDNYTDGIHPVHQVLEHMNMSTRRYIYFALFGDKLKTMDEMTAFQLSANIVVSTQDKDNFSKILHKGLLIYQRFYHIYFEVARELGKR